MPKILYKLASRERKDKLFATIDNLLSMVKHDDFVILCSFDNDDVTYNNQEFLDRLSKYSKVIYRFGNNKSKIQAINADMDVVDDWQILVVVADDQRFTKIGFDLDIIETFQKYSPDFDLAIHYPEKWSKFELIVMTIMGYKLYDYFGYIFHPNYLSQYCDDEYTRVVRALNKYHFRPITIFEHDHPAYRPELPKDELYMRNMNLNWQATDNQTYIQRRDNNFGLY